MVERDIRKEYKELINGNKIFLFMKGNPMQPMCGFSFRVVSLLQEIGVEFETYNILEDMEMREGVKEIAQWPTYPQLYIDGEFLGGCEIIEELFRSGELEEKVKN